jgi:glutamate formiminotransferase / formiminotetrahydrofolate cyclodeaminase
VSTNILDYRRFPLHQVYEQIRSEAESLGVTVRGSELVGLAPRDAIEASGRYYVREDGASLSGEDALAAAVDRLQLSQLAHFEWKERVIEYCLRRRSLAIDSLEPGW